VYRASKNNKEGSYGKTDKTSSSQLDVSKNTQKFLAKKLSTYLDRLEKRGREGIRERSSNWRECDEVEKVRG